MSFRDRLLRIVCEIPAGMVATYGDVARMAGAPRAAREVGWAMASLPDGSAVPWWRVVNRFGRISCRSHGITDQEARLRAEGIEIDASGQIDLDRFRWEGADSVE